METSYSRTTTNNQWTFHSIDWKVRNTLPHVSWLSYGALTVEEYGDSIPNVMDQLERNGIEVYPRYWACARCTGPIPDQLIHKDHECIWCGGVIRGLFIVEPINVPIAFKEFQFGTVNLATVLQGMMSKLD